LFTPIDLESLLKKEGYNEMSFLSEDEKRAIRDRNRESAEKIRNIEKRAAKEATQRAANVRKALACFRKCARHFPAMARQTESQIGVVKVEKSFPYRRYVHVKVYKFGSDICIDRRGRVLYFDNNPFVRSFGAASTLKDPSLVLMSRSVSPFFEQFISDKNEENTNEKMRGRIIVYLKACL